MSPFTAVPPAPRLAECLKFGFPTVSLQFRGILSATPLPGLLETFLIRDDFWSALTNAKKIQKEELQTPPPPGTVDPEAAPRLRTGVSVKEFLAEAGVRNGLQGGTVRPQELIASSMVPCSQYSYSIRCLKFTSK